MITMEELKTIASHNFKWTTRADNVLYIKPYGFTYRYFIDIEENKLQIVAPHGDTLLVKIGEILSLQKLAFNHYLDILIHHIIKQEITA